MATCRKFPVLRVQSPIGDDARALREIAREQARKLADVREKARQALLALEEYDVEKARDFLNRIRETR